MIDVLLMLGAMALGIAATAGLVALVRGRDGRPPDDRDADPDVRGARMAG